MSDQTDEFAHDDESGADTRSSEIQLVGEQDSVLRALRSVLGGELDTALRSYRFDFPFLLTSNDIEEMDRIVRQALADQDTIVDFIGTLRYADLSSDRFTALADLLADGGLESSPERIELVWQQFVPEPLGSRRQIEIKFVTEMPLDIEERQLGRVHNAYALCIVSGPRKPWVDELARRLGSVVKEQDIGGIYRPLYVFRHRELVFALSLLIAILFRNFAERLLYRRSYDIDTVNSARAAGIDAVVVEQTVGGKLDALAREMWEPVRLTDLARDLRIQAAGFGVLIATAVAMIYLLPRLVPRSFIGVGLNARRMTRYHNSFRFLVFSLGVVGFFVPLILSFVT